MQQHFDPDNKFIYTLDNNNNYHSYNDHPAIKYINSVDKIWMDNGTLNRDYKKGPAVISDKNSYYYKNGLLHNPIEPASIEDKDHKYYIMGIEYKQFKYNDIGEIHGYQQAFRNEQWVREIWVDGDKIEYDTLPVIINRNENEILVFGYKVNISENKVEYCDNSILTIDIINNNYYVNNQGIIFRKNDILNRKDIDRNYDTINNNNIKEVVNLWFSDRELTIQKYGHIGNWNISNVNIEDDL